MINKQLFKKNILLVLVLTTILMAVVLSGCSTETAAGEYQDAVARVLNARDGSEISEGRKGTGEHGSLGEANGEHSASGESGEHGVASEGAVTVSQAAHKRDSGESGEGEESGTEYALDEVYDVTRNGARLVLAYDATNNTFVGAVANTTSSTLQNVRVEVHLSNGTELGPTKPVNLPPGKMMQVILPATGEPFDGWSAHPEVGGGANGEHGGSGESSGEHGSFGESSGEHGGGEGGGG